MSGTSRRTGRCLTAGDSFKPEWLSVDGGLARYDELLKMRERESRGLAMLANRMRISQSSQYRADKAATAVAKAPPQGSGSRPWEYAA